MPKKKENLDDKIEIIRIEDYLRAINDDQLYIIADEFNWDRVKLHTMYRLGRGEILIADIRKHINNITDILEKKLLDKSYKYIDSLAVKKGEGILSADGSEVFGFAKKDMTGKEVLNFLSKRQHRNDVYDEVNDSIIIGERTTYSQSDILNYKSIVQSRLTTHRLHKLQLDLEEIYKIPKLEEYQLFDYSDRPTLLIKEGYVNLLTFLFRKLKENKLVGSTAPFEKNMFLKIVSRQHKYDWTGKIMWLDEGRNGGVNKKSLCQLFFRLQEMQVIEDFNNSKLIQVLNNNFCGPNGKTLENLSVSVSDAKKDRAKIKSQALRMALELTSDYLKADFSDLDPDQSKLLI